MKPVAAACLLLMLLNCPFLSYGQGENNVWCFGSGCGLNFNTTPPSSFISSMATLEGCASVCDASGNLLFFASPNTVWDRTNNAMPDGMGLNGGISCTQGAAIVQSYTNQQQYYLFTSNDAAYDPPPHKLYYSMVDMTLNSGYGDVIAAQKNIVLDTADGNVFNYYMEFKDESGKTYYYKGTVTLVR